MNTKKAKKQLRAAYNKTTHGLLSYFDCDNLSNNLRDLMLVLQYYRDIQFIESSDANNDVKLKTMQAAIVFFNKWQESTRKLAEAADLTAETRDELIKLKDTNYRNFCDVIVHNLEAWFE